LLIHTAKIKHATVLQTIIFMNKLLTLITRFNLNFSSPSLAPIIKRIGLPAGPALFLIFYLIPAPESLDPNAWKVISLAAWMVVWWISEAMPLTVTALLPMIGFPLMGIFPMAKATAPYANPIVFLFMGGFLIALAMEKRKLHTRIALNLIRLTGTHPNGIIMGFMVATGFLSMWISNTATAVMMLPIALSVIRLMEEGNQEMGEMNSKSFSNFSLALMLGIAYSANIGGTATIIGTPPNVVLVGYMEQFYGFTLDFSKYLMVGLPSAIVMMGITYWVLTHWLFPNGNEGKVGSGTIVNEQLVRLGKISRAEKIVALVFVCTALAWILRAPINLWIGTDLLNDTLIAMIGGLAMFVLPVNFKRGDFILQWDATRDLPWGILLLFGGGLALAQGMEETGIIQAVGVAVSDNETWSLWLLLLVLTSIMLFMTELMSNVALCVIFLPVVLGIADGLNLPPLLLAIPVTLASSYAFMMPVSTPPNAIVYSSGYIPMKSMVKAGLILNIIAIALLMIIAQTLVPWVYGE
jgi:solute carrier family 13 (sodium-dependent dicarboxylate transporter), member 2/3/5